MPEIKNISGKHDALDQISIKTNQFILLKNDDFETDFTIVPMELNLHFAAKIRRGNMYKYGWTEEVKFQFRDLTIKVKECQHI